MTRNQTDGRANKAKAGGEEVPGNETRDNSPERRDKSDKDGGKTETVLEKLNDGPEEKTN